MYYSVINKRVFEPKDNSQSHYYVLNLCLNYMKSQLAANLSNEVICVLDSQTLQTITTIKDLENMNHMIKYSPNSSQLLMSTSDAINIYDLRCNWSGISKQFKIKFSETNINSSEFELNHIKCFDFNSDYSYLCAGTEVCENKDVYMFFWDIRKAAAIIGSYNESHTNDMTDVCFHPNRRNILATGSCDQLVNVFDLNETEEDEALLTTLNIESDVESINWSQTNDKQLICITQEEGIQLWNYEEAVPKVSLSALSSNSKFDYAIDVLPKDNLICVGDKSGSVMICDLNKSQNEIHFVGHLSEGHNQMVRTVCSANDSVIYSGGEDGLICVWNTFDTNDGSLLKSETKAKTKLKRKEKKNRLNPY